MIVNILRPYKKYIIIFLIIISSIIIIGYTFIFNYYKDVSKNNYIVVTCQDPTTLETWEERYNNNYELEQSPTLCRIPQIQNPLYNNIEINITFEK